MKIVLVIVVAVALAVSWLVERSSAVRLAFEIETQRAGQRALAALQSERDRLRAQQPGEGELENLRRAAAEHARLQGVLDAQATARTTQPPALPLGEWTPASDWRNRGQATPHAAVETTLWAAAGGDIGTLKKLLSVTDATRTKAEALLARLPASERARYATPEDLIAAFTISKIPIGEAQLVWFNQNTEDEATACVFLQRPLQAGESVAPAAPPLAVAPTQTREEAIRLALERKAERAARAEREPPRAPDNPRSGATYLSLRRDGNDWRLVVPPSAVERMAAELAAAPGP